MLDIVNAIKKISEDKRKNNIYNRYPIRFVFTPLTDNTENDILMLQSELNKCIYSSFQKKFTIVNLYNLLAFDDAWITKTQLINYVKNLLLTEDDYIILGFSELIRFYSREDLEAIIISFMTDIESTNEKNKRIYFMCFSLFDPISLELKTNNRNETINPIIDIRDEETEEENNLISVYYANSSFESRLFSNKINTSTEWLSIYKSKKLNLNEGIVCISDTLVALYEKAKPDNFVAIEKLDSYYKLLTIMHKVRLKKTMENSFTDSFWEKIFELCKKNNSFALQEILLQQLNVKKMDSELFLSKLKNSNEHIKNVLLLYLYEYPTEFENYEYILKVVAASDKTYSNIIQLIYTHFLNFDFYDFSCRKNILKKIETKEVLLFSDDYRKSINESFNNLLRFNCFTSKVPIEGDDLFSCSFSDLCSKYNTTINYIKAKFKSYFNDILKNVILCKTIDDKVLIINLLRNDVVSLEDVSELYPDLIKYLGYRKSPKLNSSLHWISNYLFEYKLSKIMDKPTDWFNDYCNNITHENFLTWYSSSELSSPLDLLNGKIYDKIIVVDGVGAEFFDYINYIIEENGYVAVYSNISKCFLPSITSVHKEKYTNKYDEWILDFDANCIHKLYYKDLGLIPKELDEIKIIIESIFKKYRGKRIAFIADHGCTVAGRILHSKSYGFDAEHEGRCIRLDNSSNIKNEDNNDYFSYSNGKDRYLVSLSGASLSDMAKRESHGGAMIEEVVVPCIIASSDLHDLNKIEYHVKIISNKLSGLNRYVSLEITPSIAGKQPMLIEENGEEHALVLLGDNIWKTHDELTQIKTQKVKLLFDGYTEDIIIESTMGISMKGDGFDD